MGNHNNTTTQTVHIEGNSMDALVNLINVYQEVCDSQIKELEAKHNYSQEEILKDTFYYYLHGSALAIVTVKKTIDTMEVA